MKKTDAQFATTNEQPLLLEIIDDVGSLLNSQETA